MLLAEHLAVDIRVETHNEFLSRANNRCPKCAGSTEQQTGECVVVGAVFFQVDVLNLATVRNEQF